MTLDAVVLDTLRIAKAVKLHLNEIDCNHSIKDIVKEALGLEATKAGGQIHDDRR